MKKIVCAAALALIIGGIAASPATAALPVLPAENHMYAVGCTGSSPVAGFSIDPADGSAGSLPPVTLAGVNVCAAQGAYNPLTKWTYAIIWALDADGQHSWLYGTGPDAPTYSPPVDIVTSTGGFVNVASMAIDGFGHAYVAEEPGGKLHSLDLETGIATPIGTAVLPDQLYGLAYNPADGKIYGIGLNNDKIYSLNTSTGAAIETGITSSIHGVLSLQFDNNGLAWVLKWPDGVDIYTMPIQTGVGTFAFTVKLSGNDIASESLLIRGTSIYVAPPEQPLAETGATGTGEWFAGSIVLLGLGALLTLLRRRTFLRG